MLTAQTIWRSKTTPHTLQARQRPRVTSASSVSVLGKHLTTHLFSNSFQENNLLPV